jgi:hypothetical protein
MKKKNKIAKSTIGLVTALKIKKKVSVLKNGIDHNANVPAGSQ